MDFDHISRLKEHPAWRLLTADHAPLVISFFDQTFVAPGAHSCAQSELVAKLDDYLFYIRKISPENSYPRSAQEYLESWAHNDNAYLRKYYPDRGDEPCYDLTPSSEKAIEWLRSLDQKSFIGTESRLLTIFQLLRDVVSAAQSDPQARIASLEKQKSEIDIQIEGLRRGRIGPYDPTRVKECYYEIMDAVRRLLSDFRQVEENFRQLDRRTRERIATSTKSKGELLDEIFGEEDVISSSDQGRSFRAFWEFLMLTDRQEELDALVGKLVELKEIRDVEKDSLLSSLKYRLMDAGEKVQRTTGPLAEHLRRFLEDQVWLENKRIMELIRSIEKSAVELRKNPPPSAGFTILEDLRPSIDLPMARGLFVPLREALIGNVDLLEGEAGFENDAIYEIHYVDEEELKRRIQQALEENSQVSLADICASFPIKKGLSELLVYLNIAGKDQRALINSDGVRHAICWNDSRGFLKKAMVPDIIFTKAI